MNCPYCMSDVAAGAARCPACTTWITSRPPVREWLRARDGKLVAGVARGLSLRFAVPVAAVRLVFLLSALLGGWGILVYLALWIAMPREPVIDLAAPPPRASSSEAQRPPGGEGLVPSGEPRPA